jgi:hypothetical protein
LHVDYTREKVDLNYLLVEIFKGIPTIRSRHKKTAEKMMRFFEGGKKIRKTRRKNGGGWTCRPAAKFYPPPS